MCSTGTQYAGVAKPSSGGDVTSSGQPGGQGRSLMAFGVLMATQCIIITIVTISYRAVNYSFLLVPGHNEGEHRLQVSPPGSY